MAGHEGRRQGALAGRMQLSAPEVSDLRAKLWDQVREESLKAMGGSP